MSECHKCIYNGKGSSECLKCHSDETYSYPYGKYILETFDPVQPDCSGSEKVTSLDDDTEDKLRKFLYDLFDLQPLELLCLRAIMRGQSLTDFGREMTRLFTKNDKEMTRFHAFQLRKSILSKLGSKYRGALLTLGQRKELKVDENDEI